MPITLYLIRHGIAVEQGIYTQDADRPLTALGHEKTQRVAQQIAALSIQFDRLLTSPLLRAQQTATILQQQSLCPTVELHPELAPGGSVHRWLRWLEDQQNPSLLKKQGLSPSDQQRIALVGHQPDLSHWAEWLVWGKVKGGLVLKKAGIIGITLPSGLSPDTTIGQGELFWLTAPRLLLT